MRQKGNALQEIASVLARLEDEKLIEDFLEGILTPNEIEEVSSRWELVKLLEQGDSQRTISQKLGLSLCKITRGSRELKKKNSGIKRFLNEYYKQANKGDSNKINGE